MSLRLNPFDFRSDCAFTRLAFTLKKSGVSEGSLFQGYGCRGLKVGPKKATIVAHSRTLSVTFPCSVRRDAR
jgi:hypothetical protein